MSPSSRPSPPRRLLFLGLTMLLSLASWVEAAPLPLDDPAFVGIRQALSAGEISEEAAILHALRLGFEPELVPIALRPAEPAFIRCLTPVIIAYEARAHEFSAETRAAIDAYLAPKLGMAKRASYVSPSGRFEFSYSTSGPNAVSATDTSPANGIPDFVERCGQYFDESWTQEIDVLGFAAPPIGGGRYQVEFEAFGYYGLTTTTGAAPGLTRIVMHNSFLGFPPNEDPEGNPIGAAKVTAAHEFRHASQHAATGWVEAGWLELDATWMEDVVYDHINDYYNYLPQGSPISAPATALDAGGTGSYPDCIFQHWMSESWGEQIIINLWDVRTLDPSPSMLQSYDDILSLYGSSMAEGFPWFAAWNYATGSRAITGIGYGEAAGYMTAPTTQTLSSYPAVTSGFVGKLAANLVHATNLSGAPGALRVVFDPAAGSSLGLVAVIEKIDGSGVLESLAAPGASVDVSLSVPLDQISSVGFAIGNGSSVNISRAWSLSVEEIEPPAVLGVSSESLRLNTLPDQTGSFSVSLSNDGGLGSVLEYSALLMTSLPAKAVLAKSILGATLSASPASYVPGGTATIDFTVTNPSPDAEWLAEVQLDFPVGVSVLSSSDMVGGSDGDLVSNGATGDGVVLSFVDANGSWGNVYGGGEQATASVSLAFDAGLIGNLSVPYTIIGDGYGAAPHTVVGSVSLAAPTGTVLNVLSPVGGEWWGSGSSVSIQWSAVGAPLSNVKIDLSRDGGFAWEPVSASTPNDGEFTWTVSGPASANVLVRVSSQDDLTSDASDAPLNLYVSVPWLGLAAPSGVLSAGQSADLVLDFDSAGLAPGSYAALLRVAHDASNSPTVIDITLTVGDPATTADALPARVRLSANYPNPFNPSTSIQFDLPRAGRAQLRVYDIAGRLVRSLVDEARLDAGTHRVVWNGRDQSGAAVASGVYLYRLETAEESFARRMVLLK